MGENYFGITDTGRQRTNNEDLFIARPVGNGRFIAAGVIDGVGGYAGGEVAAQLTRDTIIESLDKLTGNIPARMVAALQQANESITEEKKRSQQNQNMACVVTLAVVDIERNIFYYAHVGDTRLYLFRDGSLIKVTRDHSTVGFLEETGRLTEEEAMAHPKRNEVNKALGFETNILLTGDFIDTGESPFLPGDTILICSDGLTDMITSTKIISILIKDDDLPSKGQVLINAANEAGGKDNITVALVHNDKSPVHHAATKPAALFKKDNHNTKGEPADKDKAVQLNNPVIKKNSGKKSNGLLLFLCIVFFTGFVWLLVKDYKANKVAEQPAQVITIKLRNKEELNFIDSLNVASVKIVKLTAGKSIVVTDTILIKNDSLQVIGNGATFVRDSAYNGPAFLLSASCKYILLDSLTIENFNVGVLVLNKGLHLKKVRFKNCTVPLQFQQHFSKDTVISGSQADAVFY